MYCGGRGTGTGLRDCCGGPERHLAYMVMSTALCEPWTVERFLAWEDRQEGRHEFDGADIVLMTGGSRAHQRIIYNLRRAATVLEQTGDQWIETPVVADAIALPELGIELGLEDIYRDVRFPPSV